MALLDEMSLSMGEPRVALGVTGNKIDFLIDMGAILS